MSLMAVCPKCGVENSPMNTACDVCRASLGTSLIEGDRGSEPSPLAWMAISAAITAGIGGMAWLADLHPIMLAVAMFYGPLIASARSRDNVVWHAAIGGLVGMFVLLLISIALTWDESRAMLTAAIGGRLPSDDLRVGHRATPVFMVLGGGVAVLIASILPLSLTGASVGEHLASGRRRRRAAQATVSGPSTPLSDAELAKVAL